MTLLTRVGRATVETTETGDEPLAFETVVKGVECGSALSRRYATRDEALEGHAEVVLELSKQAE